MGRFGAPSIKNIANHHNMSKYTYLRQSELRSKEKYKKKTKAHYTVTGDRLHRKPNQDLQNAYNLYVHSIQLAILRACVQSEVQSCVIVIKYHYIKSTAFLPFGIQFDAEQ